MDLEIHYYNDNWRPDPLGLNFRAFHWVELDTTSGVIKDMWLRGNAEYGSASFQAWFDIRPTRGATNTGKKWIGTPECEDVWTIPSVCRQVRIEGRRQTDATMLSFGLLPLAR